MFGETGVNRVVNKRLREIAARLTDDRELQKDLVQEMHMHMFQVQSKSPGKTLSWYIKSAEFHVRNYLRLGRSIDSHKRARNGISIERGREDGEGGFFHEAYFPFENSHSAQDPQAEMITNDVFQMISPRLSKSQREIVNLLAQGFGVREIARVMGVSHPAICKHRKKIASIAREFLQRSAGESCAFGVEWKSVGEGRQSYA